MFFAPSNTHNSVGYEIFHLYYDSLLTSLVLSMFRMALAFVCSAKQSNSCWCRAVVKDGNNNR